MSDNKVTLWDMFETDRDAEENGKWFDIGPEIKFKIRRFKSKHTTKVREGLEKPYERLRRNGVLPAEVMEKIIHDTICKSVIADWQGVYDKEGNEVAFSPSAADEILNALPELRDTVTSHSLSMDNFRDEDDEATLGN